MTTTATPPPIAIRSKGRGGGVGVVGVVLVVGVGPGSYGTTTMLSSAYPASAVIHLKVAVKISGDIDMIPSRNLFHIVISQRN
jgi:hypothetical protein